MNATTLYGNNPPEPLTPIFQKEDGWHFYDETWVYSHGPYATEQDAETALQKYAEALDRPSNR